MPKKILLADDSLTIQKVVELTFSDSDFELVCVSNGQKALEKVREDRPDLILADVVMPEKNGYEVCEAIKSNPATARIPVVLLSGTFEPFDRGRAERIGADAIVSKPFDSQQLLRQVEALLDRRPSPAPSETTAELRVEPPPASSPRTRREEQPDPFDAGFTAEDFTGSIRLPPRSQGVDPFEEEYGRGDVDSAIEAFEKEHPDFAVGSEESKESPLVGEQPLQRAAEDSSRWLEEEAERSPAPSYSEPGTLRSPGPSPSEPGTLRSPAPPGTSAGPSSSAKPEETTEQLEFDSAKTIAIPTGVGLYSVPAAPVKVREESVSDKAAARPEAAETDELVLSGPGAKDRITVFEDTDADEISASDAEVLFDLPIPEPVRAAASPAPPLPPEIPEETRSTSPAQSAEVPHEIEILAQRSSIPELTQMLSSVAKGGNDLSEDQIERLASRVVEKLSDRVVREIAWEVIPDMAEIVIKQRIKELESAVE